LYSDTGGGFRLRDTTNKVVVVVDDDTQIREALASLLRAAHFGAAVFGSGKDVLESGLLAQACCLITDVRMPGMTGFELESRVKRDFPGLPVFIITGHRDDQLEQMKASEGRGRLFYKPLDPEALLDAIKSAIDGQP
jgi:FixJ family two-component response regulator